MNPPDTTPTHNASKPTTNLLPHSGGGRLFSLLLLVVAVNLLLAVPLQARVALPTAPSNLAASGVSATQINLSWHDNSGNESGFTIQRSVSSAGPWMQIATTGVNATSYSNTGLSAATTYYYRVSAYNSRGSSSYSNVASATTGQNVLPTCTYSILPTSASFPSGGGNGSSSVAVSSGCAWTATSGATWITISAGSGTGSGTATYSVAANTGASSRTGTLTIAGQAFTVSQAAAPATGPANDYCANGIVTSGSSATLMGSNVGATKEAGEPNHGGNAGGKSVWWSWTAPAAGSVTIDTRGSSFDTLLGVYTGTSVSSLTTIASNDDIGGGVLQSTATFIAVAGTTYQIAVDGYNAASGNITLNLSQMTGSCTYSISLTSTSVGSAGGSGNVSVTTGTGCSWTATSGVTWITITAGSSGTGNGTVGYTVAANTATTSRSATLTIAGQTFTVSQAAASCTYAISPVSASAAATGASGTLTVTAGAGCAWTPSSSAAWLTCTPASGTGSGTVSYTVAANTATTARTGSLSIAGQTFTVTQAAASCTYAISPTSASAAATGASGTLSVSAGAGCAWTPSSSAAWLTCTPASGTGSGTVSYTVAANTATTSRTGSLSIAGQTFTVTQAAASCTYTISPASASAAATGASGTLTVTAGAGCAWTPSSSAAWLTCTPASGTGSGTVSYTVAANTATTARTGSLSIAGQTFTVSQAAASCTYTVSPASASAAATGASGTLSVTAGAGCAWTPSSSAAWLTCTPASGTANGSVTWTAAANTSTTTRTGTLNIAGQYFTVTQDAAPCTYAISPASASAAATGASGTLSVTAGGSCAWTPSSSAAWLTCTPASGTANGSVTWSAAANTSTTTRTGTLNIAGQYFTVTQDAAPCTYTISSTAASFSAAAATGSVNVTPNGSGCAWTVVNGPAWITITAGGSGTGSGTVSYTVAANTATTSRTGTLTIAGQTHTVTQAGAACTYSIGGSTASFGSAGGPGSVGVTAGSGCAWSASSSVSWITTSSSGTGNGTASYTVAANTATSSRSGALTIAGQNFTVSQAAATPDNPPTGVSLTSPSDGATISGTATFTGTASDDVGVTEVEFWCDGSVLLGTVTTAPYSIACNTTTMSAGSHAFTCKAYDSAGHSTTSAANTATVSNLTTTLGQLQWVKAMVPPPSSGNAFPQGVAADHSGNVVVVGWFKGTVDFGTGPISSSATGDSDAFVAKYNAQGGALWVKRFGSTLPDEATGVAIDSQDNIIVTGFFASTVDFGGTTLTATPPSDPLMTPNADIFVVKYSASGNLAWAKRFGGQLTDRGAAVAADANGNVLVVATLGSINADFGGITLSTVGRDDIALVKLSPTGTTVWAKRWGSTDTEAPKGVSVDSAGDVVVAGHFWTATDLGGGPLINSDPNGFSSDIFVAKYSGVDGSYRWAKAIGGPGPETSYGVAVDPTTGNVILTGGLSGTDGVARTVNFGGGSINVTGSAVLLAAYGPSGSYLWAKAFGDGYSGGVHLGNGVAVDGSGNIAITGQVVTTMNFGGGWLSAPYAGYFVASFTSSGAYRWAKVPGGNICDSWGQAVAIDPVGNVLTAGSFLGTANFGGTSITAPSATYAGFVAQYGP